MDHQGSLKPLIYTHTHIHVCAQMLSHVRLFATPWNVAHQAPLSMEFSMQEYWNGLPFLTSGDFPSPGIKTASLASLALTIRFFSTSATWEVLCIYIYYTYTHIHTYMYVYSIYI